VLAIDITFSRPLHSYKLEKGAACLCYAAHAGTGRIRIHNLFILYSVAEPHHFYAVPAPAPGKNFYAAPAPTLLYSKATFLKRTEVQTNVEIILLI
jgi:hypothetical protein